MSSEIQSCYIYSEDKSLSPIYLPDNTAVIVGRSPETKITHLKCSRNQVRLYATYANQMVLVQQLGHRSCGLNGYKTQRGAKLTAKHGDCLEIIYGLLPYKIEFNPPPVCSLSEAAGKKRVLSDSDSEESFQWSAKKMKNEPGSSSEVVKEERASSSSSETKKENKNSNGRRKSSDIGKDRAAVESEKDIDPAEEATEGKWEETEKLMIYTSAGVQSRDKIAAYDMDNTLIKTQSGYAFPKDHNDWQILYAEVPGKLKKLHADGYKIVIFTNQGGMFTGKIKPRDFKLKIERIIKRLGVPIQVFLAVGKDIYRKPRTGMWEKLLNDKNYGVRVDKAKSFLVGDAAGRPKDWLPGKKKDHSTADRLLGLNLALDFYTPEEHFLGQKPGKYLLPEFNPKNLQKDISICEPSDAKLTSPKQEVIIMVGGPGTGKTHMVKTHLQDYHHVNRDKLGSWQKCVTVLDRALAEGKSVVIDNTNPDVASRKKYIDSARVHGVGVRCFVMNTDKEHARHNNKGMLNFVASYTNSTFIWRCTRFLKLLLLMCLRLLTGNLFNNVQPYRKNYVEPKKEEGFTEIVQINFIPQFKNEEHRRLYEMYLLEK